MHSGPAPPPRRVDPADPFAAPERPAARPGPSLALPRPAQRITLIAVLGAGGRRRRGLRRCRPPHPEPPGRPSRPTAIVPAAPAGDGIGNLRMFTARTGWAQRLDGGAGPAHHARRGSTGRPPSPPSGDRILAVAYVNAVTARCSPCRAMRGPRLRWTRGARGTAEPPGAVRVTRVQGFAPAAGGALDFIDPEHGGTRNSRRRSGSRAPRSFAPSTEALSGARWR